MAIVQTVVVIILHLCSLLLLGRVLVSWIDPDAFHPVSRVLVRLTEPVLAPIRRLLPRNSPVDFSPLIVFVLLTLLARIIALF